jgi:hypothetical protein
MPERHEYNPEREYEEAFRKLEDDITQQLKGKVFRISKANAREEGNVRVSDNVWEGQGQSGFINIFPEGEERSSIIHVRRLFFTKEGAALLKGCIKKLGVSDEAAKRLEEYWTKAV